ncbi:MAG TPA: hypothetical protein VMY18_06175, partial [Acidobacteriota bacterium]|nr:hypothetical protein [Acidobacteriota bacterium]
RFRLRDIGDARLELFDTSSFDEAPEQSHSASRFAMILPWAIAAVLSVTGLAVWLTYESVPMPDSITARVSITFPEDRPLLLANWPSFAISADGSRIVYAAADGADLSLYLRELGQFEARKLPGTEGGRAPFFSPDGMWVGFFSDRKLMKVGLSGSTSVTLADAPGARAGGQSGAWEFDNQIVFTSNKGLSRVSAAGGSIKEVTSLNREEADEAHLWPQSLPGGAIMFTILSWERELSRVAIQEPDGAPQRALIEDAGWGRFIAPQDPSSSIGHLTFVRSGVLFSVPFDSVGMEVRGEPVPVLSGIQSHLNFGFAHLTFSDSGTLLYAPGEASAGEYSLVWVDRDGVSTPITERIQGYEDLHISPDGQRIAMTIESDTANVWIYDLVRDAWSRFVPEGESRDPIWSPDGRYVTYGVKREGRYGLFRKRYDGSGPEERLTFNDRPEWLDPGSWSSDGNVLFFDKPDPELDGGIWMLNSDGDSEPFLQSPHYECCPRISPDGKWIAYNSDESGEEEVYVKPFPDTGGRWQISTQGGSNGIWSRDGRELFYRKGDTMMKVSIQTDPSFNAGRPESIFEGRYRHTGRDYDISLDGKRFVMIRPEAPFTTTQLNLILGWSAELK